MADLKRRLILMASIVATCACANGPYVPKGPPPEYEDPPVASPVTPMARVPTAGDASAD